MTREEFYQEWKEVRYTEKRVNWSAEDTKYLSSAIEFVDRVQNLVNDIPQRYVELLKLRFHSDREVSVYLNSWNARVIELYIPQEIVERNLTFNSTLERTRYYLEKLKALLKKRLEFLNEEITETETVFLSRIQDLQSLRETD